MMNFRQAAFNQILKLIPNDAIVRYFHQSNRSNRNHPYDLEEDESKYSQAKITNSILETIGCNFDRHNTETQSNLIRLEIVPSLNMGYVVIVITWDSDEEMWIRRPWIIKIDNQDHDYLASELSKMLSYLKLTG